MSINLFRRATFPSFILQTLDAQSPMIFEFQRLFNKRSARYGLYVDETGIYDTQTQAAVKTYQLRAMNISNSDGFVGPQTARRLRIRLIDDFKG